MKRTLAVAALAAAILASPLALAYNPNQPGGGYVAYLYKKHLGRAPDEGGFGYWVSTFQGGMSLEDITYYFRTSAEASQYSASQAIALYYRDILDREADAGGLGYWTNEYTSGRRTMAEIRAAFAYSTEARNAIDAIYHEILMRAADPGGLDAYQNNVAGGATVTDVRYALFYSSENRTYHPQSFANACDEVMPYAGSGVDVSSLLQACIDQTPTGGTLWLPRGKYAIAHQVAVARPMTIATQFRIPGYPKCSYLDNHDCAELTAAAALQDANGMLSVSGGVTLDHLVVNGNKAGRAGSYAWQVCASGNNGLGSNASLVGDNITATNSVFKNALCGTGALLFGNSHNFRGNTVAYNGVHDQQGLWSDGITAYSLSNSVVSGNEIFDNTDVDVVFGACPGCAIQNNTITHSNAFASSSFAGLILHAWPGYPSAGTSGDYSGADVSGNVIDCVGGPTWTGHRCGFGLALGASAWYLSDSHAGFIHDNVVNGAQQGFAIDRFRDPTIANNYVTESGGTFVTGCGYRALTAYNVYGTTTVHPHPSETIPASAYSSFPHDGCIPNWWQNPY